MDYCAVVAGDKFITRGNIGIMEGAIASENQNKASPKPRSTPHSIKDIDSAAKD